MTEYRSLTEAEFVAWHEKYKSDNGYPLLGRNAATGKVEPLGVGTTYEYTAPVKIDDTDVRFTVDEKDVQILPGKSAPAPALKLDGTVDVVKSKADLLALDASLDTKP